MGMINFFSGQIIPEPYNHKLFFIGSPRIEKLADLRDNNIYLSDIPIYDVTRELVLLNQQRIAEIEVRYGQLLFYDFM